MDASESKATSTNESRVSYQVICSTDVHKDNIRNNIDLEFDMLPNVTQINKHNKV